MANAKFRETTERMSRMIYFKSIGKSLLITTIFMLIISAIITYTSVSESILPLVTAVVMVLSIAYSGLLSASRLRKQGLIHGAITGTLYILILLFLSWVLIRDFSVDKFAIIKGVIGIASGGIGGMIGVNLK